ncbi:MAG TPA: hypothetical protein VKB51_19605 [bacterium]|nr:hypothetical protein [bacterium]
MSSFQEKLQARKPLILAFAAGLLVGPLISGMMGWQVTSTTATKLVETATVNEQVKFCAVRARAVVADPSKLEYSERFKLAEKWARMPWQQQADSDVISGCTNNLSESA